MHEMACGRCSPRRGAGSTLFLFVVILVFAGRQPAVHAPLQSNIAPIEELTRDLGELDMLIAVAEVRFAPAPALVLAEGVAESSALARGCVTAPVCGCRAQGPQVTRGTADRATD